jgi:hypothetical protein
MPRGSRATKALSISPYLENAFLRWSSLSSKTRLRMKMALEIESDSSQPELCIQRQSSCAMMLTSRRRGRSGGLDLLYRFLNIRLGLCKRLLEHSQQSHPLRCASV